MAAKVVDLEVIWGGLRRSFWEVLGRLLGDRSGGLLGASWELLGGLLDASRVPWGLLLVLRTGSKI